MLKTIMIGTCVQVQGTFVRTCADGTILVQVGRDLFRGQPVFGRGIA